jgi:hypothetical protein
MEDRVLTRCKADFIRNGTAKGIMSMSKEHSTQLWNAVQDSKFCFRSFNTIRSFANSIIPDILPLLSTEVIIN